MVNKKQTKSEKRIIEKGIMGIMGAIMPTVVVANEGWSETIPSWIMDEVKMERLIANMQPETGACTDAEALAYLYTMSLTAPMTTEASQIYLWLAGKYFKKKGMSVPPGMDFIPDTLTKEQDASLLKLKQWIFKQREPREKQRFKSTKKRGEVNP